MSTFAALLVATPLFGLSLQVDPSLASPPASVVIDAEAMLSLELEPELTQPGTAPTTAELMKKRSKMANIHKWFGISTWSAMTVSVVLGFIQFYNLYGFWAGPNDNPCVKGDAVFGQGQCTGQPVPHLVTGVLTGALFFTTFGLSFGMPDPLGVSEGSGQFAKRLRTHKVLRWVSLSGMVAQIALGAIIANSDRFGVDRANDYKTLRGLATAHMSLGLLTYGALTWAGSIMIF
jgi:hypothetical protein